MEWGFGNRGYQIERGEFERKLVAHHFQYTPFTFGWKIKCGESKISIDPHVAVYLAADYHGRVEEEGIIRIDGDKKPRNEWEQYYNPHNRPHFREYDEAWSIWKEKDYMPFDAGLKLGVGVWFCDRWNVDLSYQRSFVPAYVWDNMDYDDGAFTNKLVLRVGFGF